MQGEEMPENRELIRRSEIPSTTGAAVLGAGLAPFGLALFLARLAAHAWGMYARHRLECRASVARARWGDPVYWICWIALAGMLIYAFLFS